MEQFLQLILDKLSSIDERLNKIEETSARHDENLKEHMKRSDLLEKNLNLIESDLDEKIEPIQKHINYVEGFFKLLGVIALIVGIYSAVK